MVTILTLACAFLVYGNFQNKTKTDALDLRLDSLKKRVIGLNYESSEHDSKINDLESNTNDLENRITELEE